MANTGDGNFPLAGSRVTRQGLTDVTLHGVPDSAGADVLVDYFFESGVVAGDAVMSSAGAATATAVGASFADAVMNANGIATAEATSDAGTVVDAVMSSSGVATAVGVAEAFADADASAAGSALYFGITDPIMLSSPTLDAVMSAAGTATAAAIGESFAEADMSTAGAASAIMVGEGGIVIAAPEPAQVSSGGAGGYLPAGDRPKQRLRKEKRDSKVYTVKIGNWPEEPDLAFIEKREQEEYSQFISELPGPDLEDVSDEEEQALMMILALAA